jgi:acetyltransferase
MALAGDARGEWEGEVDAVVRGLRSSGRIRNPIDTGSLAGDWTQIDAIYASMERDGLNGPTIVYTHVAPTAKSNWDLLKILVARRARTAAPVIVVVPGGLNPALEAGYAAEGLPLFGDIASAFDGLACHFATMNGPDHPDRRPAHLPALEKALRNCDASHGGVVSEVESARVLALAGVPVVQSLCVNSPEEVARVFMQLDGPVVMKAMVPGVAHKNDAGLVKLSISSAREAVSIYESFLGKVGDHDGGPGSQIIMQPMLRGSAELIVGVTYEQELGHFLVCGLGGIYAEALNEVALVHVPASREAICETLLGSRTGALLCAIDDRLVSLVANVLENLQSLVLTAPDLVRSIDVNPLLVREQEVIAVDALMVLGEAWIGAD